MRPPPYQPALTPRYGLVGEGSSAARGDDGVGTAEEAAAAGRDLQRRAARWLPALAGMAMARTTLAARVVPRDGCLRSDGAAARRRARTCARRIAA